MAGAAASLTSDKIEMEAYIDWNAPPMGHADALIRAALDHHFKGEPWHFHHRSEEGQSGRFGIVSKVLQRLLDMVPKFPWTAGV